MFFLPTYPIFQNHVIGTTHIFCFGLTIKLERLFWVKFHVEIFWTPLFQNGTPIFQMGLLFLKKEESRTPSFEIQVRTLFLYKFPVEEGVCCLD